MPILRIGACSSFAIAAILVAPQCRAQGASAASGDTAVDQRSSQATPSTDQAAPQSDSDAGPPNSNPGTANGSQVRDIVVVGRKRARSEQIQETPISITAFDRASLDRAVVVDLPDVGKQVPNASLQSSSQRGVQNFSIRGAGVSGTTASDEPAVGIFQDGVYWGSNYGALGDLFDLEDVEILRGPQGTLFGRNVTGGAITVRSARPTNDYSGKVTLGVGNYGLVEASAVANVPIVDDKLAARIAAKARNFHGYFTDTVTNSDYGKQSSYIVRPSIKWTPSDSFDLTLIGEFDSQYGDPTVVRGVSPSTIPDQPVKLPAQEGYVTPDDFWSVSPNNRGFSNIKVYFGAAEMNWDIGPGTLTSVTGYRKVRTRVLTDFDGTPSHGFLQGIEYNQHQFSEELRYAAEISSVSFTTGLYYFRQKLNAGESRSLNNEQTQISTRSKLDNESYAAFAEADLHITPALTGTVGARYTHETKDAKTAPFGSCVYPDGTCTFGDPGHYSANKFTPKLGLSYQFSPDHLVFASFTKGFRSGGFSLRGTPLSEPYQAEKVTAYEVGTKNDFFDNSLRFNVSLFYNKYDDLQRTVLGVSPTQGVIQSVFNAADATIKGAEAEIVVIPVNGLTLSGNYGYTDATYDTFTGFENPERLEFVRVPKHTFNVTANYEHELSNGDSIAFDITDSFTGKYYFDDPNTPGLIQDAYNLVNATLSYRAGDDIVVSIYGKNLTNEEYVSWGANLGVLGQNSFPQAPRTYGIRLSSNF